MSIDITDVVNKIRVFQVERAGCVTQCKLGEILENVQNPSLHCNFLTWILFRQFFPTQFCLSPSHYMQLKTFTVIISCKRHPLFFKCKFRNFVKELQVLSILRYFIANSFEAYMYESK